MAGRGRDVAIVRPLGRIDPAGDYLESAEMAAAAVTGREAARAVGRRPGAP
jgi:hypothetical protein